MFEPWKRPARHRAGGLQCEVKAVTYQQGSQVEVVFWDPWDFLNDSDVNHSNSFHDYACRDFVLYKSESPYQILTAELLLKNLLLRMDASTSFGEFETFRASTKI